MDLCAENEGCICQEACIPGICPCMKWYTPHKRFTPDQRSMMQFDTRCELIRQCSEACTCFISSCCNRGFTQMKSKTLRRQDKGKLATVVPVMVMETPFSSESHPRQLGLPVVSFFAACDLPAGTELRYENDFRAVNVGESEEQIPIPSEKRVDEDKRLLVSAARSKTTRKDSRQTEKRTSKKSS